MSTSEVGSRARLRVGTLNVHGWRSRRGLPSFNDVVLLLAKCDLDVVALQEASKARVPDLANKLGYYHICHMQTAILCRWNIRVFRKAPQCMTRHTRVRIDVPAEWHIPGDQVDVVCLHLSHRRETNRLAELTSLLGHLSAQPLAPAHILLGDFNALNGSDYSRRAWKAIAAVRATNTWESPVVQLMETVCLRRLSLADCWQRARARSGPLSTCRFGTRIDYILLSESLGANVDVEDCTHHVAIPDISDHNLVTATLVPKLPAQAAAWGTEAARRPRANPGPSGPGRKSKVD